MIRRRSAISFRRPNRLRSLLRASLLAFGLLAVAASASAQTDRAAALEAGRTAAAAGEFEVAYERFVEAWDPAGDDPAVLAAMAGAASRIDALDDLRDRLAPVVATDADAKHAARFWAAAALQTDVPADSVQATLVRRVEARPGDLEALTGYVRVWMGHGGFDLAEALLDRARSAGTPDAAVVALLGDVRAAGGEPLGALEAYARAVAAGGPETGEILRRAQTLLEEWPGGEVPAEAVDAIDRIASTAEGPAASALAALRLRAGIAAGAWEAAIDAATDPALGATERAATLRAVAVAARDAGALGPAREAAEALRSMGPPYARPGDRELLADVASRQGDVAGAAAAWRDATGAAAADPDLTRPGPADPVTRARAALERGDREALVAALEAASSSGVDPAALAVPRGDLWLARGRPDSAMAAWQRGIESGTSRPAGLSALGRARLLQSLGREGAGAEDLTEVGEALLAAPAEPSGVAERLRDLARRAAARDSAGVAAAILEGLAAEWEGRAGDPSGASRSLERAARETPVEAPALLLAAGRWADRADEAERARALWREVALEHPTTPYALEARRLLAAAEGAR